MFINAVDDSTTVVTAMHMMDTLLKLTLVLKFRKIPMESEVAAMFAYPGPLSSLAAKTSLCKALGILEPQMAQEIDMLRDIRNRFCHSYFKRTFDDYDIARDCGTLYFPATAVRKGGLEHVQRVFNRFQPWGKAQYVISTLIVMMLIVKELFRTFEEMQLIIMNYVKLKEAGDAKYETWFNTIKENIDAREAAEAANAAAEEATSQPPQPSAP